MIALAVAGLPPQVRFAFERPLQQEKIDFTFLFRFKVQEERYG